MAAVIAKTFLSFSAILHKVSEKILVYVGAFEVDLTVSPVTTSNCDTA